MKTTTGYAVRIGEGFYDMNGIGDWSLAGDEETCAIFETPTQAAEAMLEVDLGDDFDIVPITRTVSVILGSRTERPQPLADAQRRYDALIEELKIISVGRFTNPLRDLLTRLEKERAS